MYLARWQKYGSIEVFPFFLEEGFVLGLGGFMESEKIFVFGWGEVAAAGGEAERFV